MWRSAPLTTRLARLVAGEAEPKERVRVSLSARIRIPPPPARTSSIRVPRQLNNPARDDTLEPKEIFH
jgi:hypothetical protein